MYTSGTFESGPVSFASHTTSSVLGGNLHTEEEPVKPFIAINLLLKATDTGEHTIWVYCRRRRGVVDWWARLFWRTGWRCALIALQLKGAFCDSSRGKHSYQHASSKIAGVYQQLSARRGVDLRWLRVRHLINICTHLTRGLPGYVNKYAQKQGRRYYTFWLIGFEQICAKFLLYI
jgi:hypothetical protein